MAQNYGGGDWSEFPSFERKNVSMNAAHDRLPVPVTIKRLVESMGSTEDTYTLGMYQFTTVQVIGIVDSSKEDFGNTNFVLSDPENSEYKYTVVKYSSENEANRFVDVLAVPGTRVHAIGKLKEFDGNRIIMTYCLREMDNEKEYTIYKLEARVAELFFEKNVIEKIREGRLNDAVMVGMLSPPAPVLRRRESDEPPPKQARLERVSHPSFNNRPSTSSNVTVATTTRHFGYTGSKAKIYAIFMGFVNGNEYSEQTGVPVSRIYNKMGNVPMEETRKILEQMESDGSIFFVDDNENYWIIES